jgi:hypothetical protein
MKVVLAFSTVTAYRARGRPFAVSSVGRCPAWRSSIPGAALLREPKLFRRSMATRHGTSCAPERTERMKSSKGSMTSFFLGRRRQLGAVNAGLFEFCRGVQQETDKVVLGPLEPLCGGDARPFFIRRLPSSIEMPIDPGRKLFELIEL